ncbi:hypothetical protein Tco_0645721 [Tanacetum coccineum]
MVAGSGVGEKLMEAFIGGTTTKAFEGSIVLLPQSLKLWKESHQHIPKINGSDIKLIPCIKNGIRDEDKKLRTIILPPTDILEIDITRISAQRQITRPQESILRDELAFVHFRISTLETTLEDIQVSSESSPI